MSDDSILDRVLALKEKLDSRTSTDVVILSVLGDLDSIPVDRTLLAKTKVGVSVSKYKQHASNDVVRCCRKLLEKWRNLVSLAQPMPSQKATSALAATNSPAALKPSTTSFSTDSQTHEACSSDNQPQQVEKPSVSEPGDSIFSTAADNPASGTSKNSTDDTSSKQFDSLEFPGPRCFDLKRDRAREILFKAFLDGIPAEQYHELNTVEVGRVSASIEIALWEHHVKLHNNAKEYQFQLRAIKSNLADKKNPEFNIRIYFGVLSPTQLATLPSVEMASDAKKRERQKTKRDALEACQSDWDLRNIKRAEGQFPCGKCKSSSTTYFQMQTRSSDEPMTTFVSCLNCGNRWKF